MKQNYVDVGLVAWTAVIRALASLACAGLFVAAPAAFARATLAEDPAALTAACDAPSFATTLKPAASTVAMPARAVWLSRTLLQWPGVAPQGRFVLASSATGALVATPGQGLDGADDLLPLEPSAAPVPAPLAASFKHVGPGLVLQVGVDAARLAGALRGQVLVVREDAEGRVLEASAVQVAGALDDLYGAAAQLKNLGVQPGATMTAFSVWAPTARSVHVCQYAGADGAATRVAGLALDARTGAWNGRLPGRLAGGYYAWLVDVVVPGVGLVRNRVTDPYSISLNADSRRSYIGDLGDAALMPAGWRGDATPPTVKRSVDMAIYELHLRDFSAGDASVPAAHRGKYLAFTDTGSAGMRHLRALAQAGLTDVHLLPVFDLASVPERGCTTPRIAGGPADETQQAAVVAGAATDCFNWGYDPLHYNAPEGSYASDANDGAVRVREFRAMVRALHRVGLRVGMDVVYNHTSTSGQAAQSVLDRIVPGYYQRLDANGQVEHSTCCDNTASEHLMMGKLLVDSVVQWAVQYHVDSFRFDLMGHQPRAVMEALQQRLRAAAGREIPLIGEGWNFGEVADGARFVQASQLSLNGSGIGTFSDRARDAVRGGSATDSSHLRADQGWVNGEFYDPNGIGQATRDDLLGAADMIRVGLAGSVRDMTLTTWRGATLPLSGIDYGGQPAGYASAPGEAVNYVENHDNQTLFDNNLLKLPLATSGADRARVQILGAAVVAFSQGVAYFHAGVDLLRSKSFDMNSFDSGDWFNRLDWTYTDNGFGAGLPPKADNGDQWAMERPLLADASLKPAPADIAWTRDAFRDLLRIRASTSLFHLATATDVRRRLSFPASGPQQEPRVIAELLDGQGLAGARFGAVLVFLNADKLAHTLDLPALRGRHWALHPVHLAARAADRRIAQAAGADDAAGRFTLPARSAIVFVAP
ncbi:MAG: alpha-1,6-glucosidase domain-containing protein [Betaproteobacteria bacterium]